MTATDVLDRSPRGAATALPDMSHHCGALAWLQGEGRFLGDIPSLIKDLNAQLVMCGLPLHRSSVMLRTLHPLNAMGGYVWHAGKDEVKVFSASHEMLSDERFVASPIRLIFEGTPGIRRRLTDPDCPRDFPILHDLDEEGVTDYLILPLAFSDGGTYAASWATKAPGGFSDPQVERILHIMPTLAMALEIRSVRGIARNLADTYLGQKAGGRVLSGAIDRGSREELDAVVWYSDLRGFTAMTDRLHSEVLLDLLNDHFEHIAQPIAAHGGEVLKFMGDGLLAIFPIADLGGHTNAARLALDAAGEAIRATAERNVVRADENKPVMTFGVGLHLGSVVYGNIGAPERLDFTVIGRAVNQAARIEGQCRTMDRPLLTSAPFAEAAPVDLVSLGFHVLRGMRDPQELFTLPAAA